MSNENKSIVTYVAAGGIVAIIVTAIIGMIVLAVRLDGEIANSVYSSFQWIVVTLIPVLGGIIGVDTLKTIKIATLNAAASSSAAPAEPTSASDPGGPVDAESVAI